MHLPGKKVRQRIDANGKRNGLQDRLRLCRRPARWVDIDLLPILDLGPREATADEAELGVLGAVLASRYLESVLFGVGAFDPTIYVETTVILLGLSAAAAFVPARPAARVDPVKALRME